MNDERSINIHPKITPKENLEFSKLSARMKVPKVDLYNLAITKGLNKIIQEFKNGQKVNRKEH